MIGVSILHTLFALVVYRIELTVIVEREVFNALKGDSAAGIVACFLLFGILLFVSGIAIYTLEIGRASCWVTVYIWVVGV